MRPGPSTSTLATAASWQARVASWLGGAVLADDVPVSAGKVSWNVTRQVPDSLTLTVPRFTVEDNATRDWLPADPKAPLARFGQVLDVTVFVADVPVRLGRFLITDWEENDGAINVTAAGLLQAVSDDRLTAPTSPRDGGTLRSELQRLLPGYMGAQFDPALVDRECPKSMEWDEDRLAALYEIVDAWPARMRVDAWGQVMVRPPLPPFSTPVVSLTDGGDTISSTFRGLAPGESVVPSDVLTPGSTIVFSQVSGTGTVITAPANDTRDGSYNMVVARSSADGVTAQAVASVLSGPMAPTGEYRPVPKFFASPLLLSVDQCQAAAQSMLADAVRPSSSLHVVLAPDPRLELDDPVELIIDQGRSTQRRVWGYITAVELPLTVSDGAMRVDVAIF